MPHHVYVIELERAAGPRRDPRIPWVYVGSSARDPELRFAQHQRGYRASRLVKRFGLRLRPDLYDDIAPLRGSRQALIAERTRAEELAGCGFVAHCDGTSFGKGSADWAEWAPERIAPVIDHVEVAASELIDAAFEPLTPELCGRLLHGERGFWTQQYIDTGDPPPAYGLFAHVGLEALTSIAASAHPVQAA